VTKPIDHKTCHCAAYGPDECICVAWDDAQRMTVQIREAVDAACTCGGGDPGHCCPACDVWHRLYPAKRGKVKP